MTDFVQYQADARVTADYPLTIVGGFDSPGVLCPLIYPTIGLSGEVGEYCNKVKKVLRDTNGMITPEVRQQLLDELGDILWYVSENVSALDAMLDDVALANIRKLKSRAERGMIGGSGDVR